MENRYTKQFLDRLDSRYAIDSDNMSYSEWITRNTTLRKKPFGFKDYPFQPAIVNDMHPNLSVIKCSQVGLTEIQIRKFFAILRRLQGVSGIFSLPNEKLFKRVSKTRVRPLITADKVFTLEGEEKSVRSMDLFQIGESYGYFTGCTESDATSIPADILFHDELDLSPMNMIGLFQSRMNNSIHKIRQRFSTPSFLEYGIDASFSLTDQREFMMRCSSCNHYQIPRFTKDFVHIPGLPEEIEDLSLIDEILFSKLDLNNSMVVCEKCRAPLDLANKDLREWVARYPDRTSGRGYRVRPFSSNRITIGSIISQLIEYRRQDYLRGWHNTVLGEAYTGSDARLTTEEITSCMTSQASIPSISEDAPVFMGIDMGLICHLTLATTLPGGDIHAFYFESMPFKELKDRVIHIQKTYRLVYGCSDRHPYTPLAEEIRDMTGGLVLPVEYRGTAVVRFIDDEFQHVSHAQADRTTMIDEVAKRIRTQTLKISGHGVYRQTIIKHLRDMVRDEKPDKPAKWVKLTGDDHFFHSLAFLLMAIKMKTILECKTDLDDRILVNVSVGDISVGNENIIGYKARGIGLRNIRSVKRTSQSVGRLL